MIKTPRLLKCISIIFVALFVSGVLILFFSPVPPLLEGVSFSRAVYDKDQHLLRLSLSQDDKFRLYTPLQECSPQLIQATLLQEDQYFYNHYGINPVSLLKAFWQTYVAKSRRVGASTITMQLARIRYGINSKNSLGKLWQIVRALHIELHYSKDQILEAYLNLAPYGSNIEGIGAASLIYFDTQAKSLSLPQAITLSLIPQNPNKRARATPELNTSRALLFERWLQLHPEDKDKQVFFNLPLEMHTIHDLPFKAPHLVNSILKTNSLQTIKTSLDLRTQEVVERITRHYLQRKHGLGVFNAAVLLVDTRDMHVKALLGSANFFDKSISGQINGVETRRSPGSTLKPFIYGLAIDQGLIHPNTVLKDVPHSFNGYNPENFDYDFMGPIKAKDALVLSRNVPAVYLSNQLHAPNLYQFLEAAQVSNLKPESQYGLSLNLGGVELTMKELTALYAMLVNEGVWKPIHLQKQEGTEISKRLLSPEASYLVLDMLKNTDPVSQTSGSWKTGTSSGFRDAWTLGTFGPYVLAVWIGNFDNSANQAFVGKDIAAPLFFELVHGIRQERGPLISLEKDPKSMHLQQVQVCKASGMLPTPYCTDTEATWFIPGKSPIKTDTIFREVAINPETGLRTCHIDEHTRFEIYEFWPSDLLKIFKAAGIQRRTPPFFEADCLLTETHGLSPEITSPQAGLTYVIRVDQKQNNTIPLTAVTDAGIEFVYWFINESFIAKTKADEPFMWPAKPGKFMIRVVDEHGLAAARAIDVRLET